jgi:hypothetical protein
MLFTFVKTLNPRESRSLLFTKPVRKDLINKDDVYPAKKQLDKLKVNHTLKIKFMIVIVLI